ncbi:MAG: hypothetical protein Q4C45_07665 [Oscillospiraceae bacterium]|nr:hypothetical protein [Oscillospiraceae bacterium]
MMNEDKKPKRRFSYVWPLAGLYLLYLAYQMVRDVWNGATAYPAMAIAGAAAFAAIGGFLLWREWKTYQYDLAHKDDPSTWSDDPAVWADTAAETQAGEGGELPEAEDGGPEDDEDGGEDEV